MALNDKGNPRTDINNPKESLRTTPLLDLMILRNFVKKGDVYEDGTIYDPKNGKTYSCVIKIKDDTTIEVRGYIGISMIGRTTTWSRIR